VASALAIAISPTPSSTSANGSGLLAGASYPSNPTRSPVAYRLRLRRAHSVEALDVIYRRGNEYLASATRKLNHFLRDYRTGEDGSYDVREFDLLYLLMKKLHHPNGVIEVLCGYRSPRTNAYIRAAKPAKGAAENSLHIQSKAVDIRVAGVSTERLRNAAVSLHMGGVGYYPEARFVHVDVGPVRQWTLEAGRAEIVHARGAMYGAKSSGRQSSSADAVSGQ
jgi:uncharacterized protein YcbK (DUF882 family)